jgi:hypothetical protein
MLRPIAALVIAALSVTPALAADEGPTAESAQWSPVETSPAVPLRVAKSTGKMPVRGIDHLAVVYGDAAAPKADAQPLVADQEACNLFPRRRI